MSTVRQCTSMLYLKHLVECLYGLWVGILVLNKGSYTSKID